MLWTKKDLGEQDAQTMLHYMSGISKRYEHYLLTSKDEYTPRPAGIHASEVSPCPRKAMYTLLGTEKKIVRWHTKWRKRFEHGHKIHEWVQNNFGKMAEESGGELVFHEEVEVTPETSPLAERYQVYSHCDGIIEFRKGGEPYCRMGLEIKSMSPTEFAKLKKPKPEHVDQGHVYMACLDLPAMYFMYVNKGNENNTPSTGPFLVPYSSAVWDRLEQLFDGWFDLRDVQEMPPRFESIVCEFCPYDWTCDPGYTRRYKKHNVSQKVTRFRR